MGGPFHATKAEVCQQRRVVTVPSAPRRAQRTGRSQAWALRMVVAEERSGEFSQRGCRSLWVKAPVQQRIAHPAFLGRRRSRSPASN